MYNCEICAKVFNRKDNLSRHKKNHSKKNKVKCKFCSKNFSRSDSLKRHIHKLHNAEETEVRSDKGQSEGEENNSLNTSTTVKKTKKNDKEEEGQEEEEEINSKFFECLDCNENIMLDVKKQHFNSKEHRINFLSRFIGKVKIKESAFRFCVIKYLINNDNSKLIIIQEFLEANKLIVEMLLKHEMIIHNAIKIQFVLYCTYRKESVDSSISANFNFQTKFSHFYMSTSFHEFFNEIIEDLKHKSIEFDEEGSNWGLISINSLELGINKYLPLRGSKYVELPKEIKSRNAIINVQNTDENCFLYAVLASLLNQEFRKNKQKLKNPQRPSNYTHLLSSLKYNQNDLPMQIKNIPLFEKNNKISINVFILERNKKKNEKNNYKVNGPIHAAKKKYNKHVNLLLYHDYDKNIHHFVCITNLAKLVSQDISNWRKKKFICDGCLLLFYNEEKFNRHTKHNECIKRSIQLPSAGSFIEFKNFERQLDVEFYIISDFEAILSDSGNFEEKNVIHNHIASMYAYKIISKEIDDPKLNEIRIDSGRNTAKSFVQNIIQDVCYIFETYFSTYQNKFDFEPYKNERREAKSCHICKKKFSKDDEQNDNHKVIDHCHRRNVFRGIAHKQCNLKYQDVLMIPVIFHNLNYDVNLFLKEIGNILKSFGTVSILPMNKQKFIAFNFSFNVAPKKKFQIRFIDSFRFLSTSLDQLVSMLKVEDFINLKKHFGSNENWKLLTKKGIYPYEYINSFDKFEEKKLPSINEFFSQLTNKSITQEEYERAENIFHLFKCKNLHDYTKLYITTDVLLLSDVWTQFLNVTKSIYGLCANHYYTAASLSWDAMLKYCQIKIELLTDIEEISFIMDGIRGGVCVANKHYAKSNNKYMENYNKNEESTFLQCLDFVNLYGYAMSQKIPYGSFELIHDENRVSALYDRVKFNLVDENSEIGYIFDVDIEIDEKLHDLQSDFPFCPQLKIPPGSKHPKLILDFEKKIHYKIHYMNLKQIIANGLKITKIHRVMKFKQSNYLQQYIEMNMKERAKTNHPFLINYFKLMNNVIFGKSIENILKYKDVRLATKWDDKGNSNSARKLIASPLFKGIQTIDENICCIELKRLKNLFNKPIFIGFCCLEFAKFKMYQFYYDYLLKKFNRNDISLCYTDTDSLILHIKTDDLFAVYKNDLEKYFDTSNFSEENLKKYNYQVLNKKVVGMMKDEFGGELMTEFVALQAKCYSFKIENKNSSINKIKGIEKYRIKEITFEDFKTVLDSNVQKTTTVHRIKGNLATLQTVQVEKVALRCNDDKRFQIPDSYNTLPWYHYKIKKYENEKKD